MTPITADMNGDCTKCGSGPYRLVWGHCEACWAANVQKRADRRATNPTALYRLFNEWGDLLYVGTTVDPKARWRDHRKKMPWWPQVDRARTRIEWLGRDANVVRCETDAIRAELPWYNRSGYQLDDGGNEQWPNLPDGCPPQPWYTHRVQAEYRPVWRAWYAVFRDYHLNPEERTARDAVSP